MEAVPSLPCPRSRGQTQSLRASELCHEALPRPAEALNGKYILSGALRVVGWSVLVRGFGAEGNPEVVRPQGGLGGGMDTEADANISISHHLP